MRVGQFVATFVLVLAVTTSSLLAQGEKKERTAADPLAPFKALAGEWTGKGMHGEASQDVTIVYKVTSGGSAVVETIGPGTDHEMVTVIHPDGNSLVLTHYCMLGNQPQMKATPKDGAKSIAFDFVKATNLKSDKDMYMHDVTFTFVDKDTLKTEWTNFNEGKAAGKAVFELKRKK